MATAAAWGESPYRDPNMTCPITLVYPGSTSITSTPSRAARDRSRAWKAA